MDLLTRNLCLGVSPAVFAQEGGAAHEAHGQSGRTGTATDSGRRVGRTRRVGARGRPHPRGQRRRPIPLAAHGPRGTWPPGQTPSWAYAAPLGRAGESVGATAPARG